MPLLALPNEILDRICSYLEYRKYRKAFMLNYCRFAPPEPYYVGNFRMASRLCAAIGLQYLAREVTLVATPQSLCRLLTLSCHPVLKANVKSLRISCFMYADPENFEEVQLCLGERPASSIEFPVTLPAYYAYISLCHGQQKLVQSEHYSDSLKLILSRLPNLRSVKIFDGATMETIPHDMAPYRAVGYDEGCFLGHSGNWGLQKDFASRVLNHVLIAMKDLTSKEVSRGFALDYDYTSCGISMNKIVSWQRALGNLRCLKLNQTTRDQLSGYKSTQQYSDWRGDVTSDTLASFIAAAQNLHELEICMTALAMDSAELLHAKAYWPCLKKLTLFQVTLNVEHMIGFFRRQGRTLEVLDLSLSNLEHTCDPTGWAHFFERTHIESLLSLRSLRLCNISGLDRVLYFKSWKDLCPNTVPPHRAMRYLMCGKKTDMDGKLDATSLHPYDWNSVSWESIAETCKAGYAERQKLYSRMYQRIWGN